MFKRIVQRFEDMQALTSISQSAEQHSKRRNEGNEPSAEHFVLAAFDALDGAAVAIFRNLDLNTEDFEDALREQYKNSLSAIGIDVDESSLRGDENTTQTKGNRLYVSSESGSELLRNMSQRNRGKALSSADILIALDSVSVGPAHRAFSVMGTSAKEVATAAREYLSDR